MFDDLTIARFWSKVDKRGADECWPWKASLTPSGYGCFYADGRTQRAHRIAWRIANGRDIPPSIFGCHSCDNPICVNPSHIWLGTRSDNMLDCARKGRLVGFFRDCQTRTHCKRGHPLSGDNLLAWPLKNGHRQCAACAKAVNQRIDRRRKEERRLKREARNAR